MKSFLTVLCLLVFGAFLAGPAQAQSVSDPRITTWLTANSGKYARVWETAADKNSGNAVTTWPRAGLTNGGGGVATKSYADVQRVAYSANHVYIQTTGLASYTMGNWLTPNGMTYTSWPTNRGAIHRIPRNPSIPTTKQKTNGSGGVWVNGVYFWNNGDAQSYSTTTGVVSMQGSGIWNRLAGVAEAFNFDTTNGHQPSNGAYHNHINPVGLRYQLNDNISYNSSSKTYSEAGPTRHSPILGWANDGLPVYGPYGYSSAMDPNSGVRRMTTGFQKRDGTNGTVNLAVTGRTTLPVWAASVQGRNQTLSSSQYGPAVGATYTVGGGVTSTYSLGIFAEDYEYLGDLGKTQGVDFDLNRQNVRYCVTPEFPNGTYAYFVCIDASGNTVFPDVINQEYFGTAAMGQGTVTSISESVIEYIDAGPAMAITVTGTASGGGVALGWNSAEGATYSVESSPNGTAWSSVATGVTSGGVTTSYTAPATANYFRVTLTAIATYDTAGTYGTPVGKTGTLNYAAASTPPSITTQPSSVTVASGASATFSVVATGESLTYQWQKNGSAISGATAASYTIAAVQTADAGSYTVVVTNSGGSVTSSAATLALNAAGAPAITTQPTSSTVTAGANVTFTVVASGVGLSYQWRKDGTAITGATSATYSLSAVQAANAGSYTVVVTNTAGSVTSNAATLTVGTTSTAPTLTTPSFNLSTAAGGTALFYVTTGAGSYTYQWSRNGEAIGGATSTSLSVSNVQPASAGIYGATVSGTGGTTTSDPFILGVSSTSKVIGTGSEVGPNITHANGNVYDQVLLEGGAATVTADAGQILRISFIDLSDDIVQVEFFGAGTLTVVLDSSTGPATAVKYNQATTYMRGHAGITVTGADETTNLSIFSVGSITATNQALFRTDVSYDGMADVAFVAIASQNGKFGGLRAANASFNHTRGVTGVYAPNVIFTGPVFLHDINGYDNATAMLVIGSATETRVTGGDLLQANSRAVKVKGVTQLRFMNGSTSHGGNLAAQANRGRLEQDGVDVSATIVVNP
jgi:hypothetical protein